MAATRSTVTDIEVLKLAQVKAETGRDLDASVDEDTLVSGETGAGTFGVFKFFTGIRRFFKGLTALGTLADTGRIPTHDADGNVSYVTPQQILDCVSTINGDKNFANNVSVAGALNVMGGITDQGLNLQHFSEFWVDQGTPTKLFDLVSQYGHFNLRRIEITRSIRNGDWGSSVYNVTFFGGEIALSLISEYHTTYNMSITDGYWVQYKVEDNQFFIINNFSDPIIIRVYW